MLSAPGFRFHRILTPFFQLVVGPALPAVWRVLEYTLFCIVVFLFSCYYFIFITVLFYFVFIVVRVPLHPLGPPGGFLCLGDARRDL